VPDVAYLSYARLPYEIQQVTDEPKVAPDAVVEVLSSGDRRADVEEKIRVYLAAGTSVVFVVDPKLRVVRIRDAHGERVVSEGGLLEHAALPGFSLRAHQLFSIPKPA
jgi:Uma2 family endonuclease